MQVREFYANYRGQRIAHPTREDTLVFSTLAAQVGDESMHREEPTTQREQRILYLLNRSRDRRLHDALHGEATRN